SVFVRPCVALREFVPFVAVGLPGVSRRGPDAAKGVHAVRYALQVVRIRARPEAAVMVGLFTLDKLHSRNLGQGEEVNLLSVSRPAELGLEDAVAVFIEGSTPPPTVRPCSEHLLKLHRRGPDPRRI